MFPNEWGNKKHPLFFLGYNDNKRTKVDPNRSQELEQPLLSEKVEEVEALYKEKEARNEALIIRNLFKTYPSGKKAVTNLSL